MRRPLALLLILLTCAAPAPPSRPTPGGGTVDDQTHDGVTARDAPPPALHLRNVGGSDGSGLCVFTSIEVAADFQGIEWLEDMQSFMRSRPGGGWPEKVDRMIAEKLGPDHGLNYLHLYGVEALPLLELACANGYLPCVTYGFGERYGLPAIDHMVNLVHLDGERACVLDNNYPGGDQYEWMSRSEFEVRFGWSTQGAGEGWAILFLDGNPQPPEPLP